MIESVAVVGLLSAIGIDMLAEATYSWISNKWKAAGISNHDLQRAFSESYKDAISAIEFGLRQKEGLLDSIGKRRLYKEVAANFDQTFLTPFVDERNLTEAEFKSLARDGTLYCQTLRSAVDTVLPKTEVSGITIENLLLTGHNLEGSDDLSRLNQNAKADLMTSIRKVEGIPELFFQLLEYKDLLTQSMVFFFGEKIKADERVKSILTHNELLRLRQEQSEQHQEQMVNLQTTLQAQTASFEKSLGPIRDNFPEVITSLERLEAELSQVSRYLGRLVDLVGQDRGLTEKEKGQLQAGLSTTFDLKEKYDFQEKSTLGFGAVAVVYRAMHKALKQVRAVKVLKEEYRNEEEIVERFLREAAVLGSLRHPNIVQIYDAGGGGPGLDFYIEMEFIEGVTLRNFLKTKKFDWSRTLKFIKQLAAAIQTMHETGIIHRDLNPRNIMVTSNDDIKVMDFGIAKIVGHEGLTRDGQVMGTSHYMAPEQAIGQRVDERADIYAFGLIVYELCTRRLPSLPPQPMRQHEACVPEWLEPIIAKCLEQKRDDRFLNMGEIIAAICEAGKQQPSAVEEEVKPELKPTALQVPSTKVTGVTNWKKLIRMGRSRIWRIAAAFITIAVIGSLLYVNLMDGTQTVSSLSLNLVGNYSTSREANSVFVAGNTAYVANGGDGLLILDVSIPSEPNKIGQYPLETVVNSVMNVVVVDNIAYVTEQGGNTQSDKMVLLDVGIPSNPIKLGEYEHDTHGTLDSLAVVDNISYLTAHDELILLDVSTPSTPVKIGEIYFDSNITNPGVTVADNIAYVMTNDFHIIDVRIPSKPVQIGQFDTSDWGSGVAVVSKMAYVVGWSGGLEIIDVSIPSQPTKLGRYKEVGQYELLPPGAQGRHTMLDVSVVGSNAYVTYIFGIDHGTWTETLASGIVAIDVSNPSDPVKIAEYSQMEETSSVYVLGDRVFSTDTTRGVFIFNLAEPSQVETTTTTPPPITETTTATPTPTPTATTTPSTTTTTTTTTTQPTTTTIITEPQTQINFLDPNLEDAIREAIGKSTGDIYQYDLEGLTSLYARNYSISDLTGLEYCINLNWIDFNNNQISDLSPLAGLTNLTALDLENNQISDISPLTGLNNLTGLNLDHNQINDISSLAGLTKLDTVGLSGNQISDISPLVANAGLAAGDEVDLRDYLLSADSINIHIPELQARGVTVYYSAEVIINFTDPNLDAVIREIIRKPIGDIYQYELDGLTSLDAGYRNISDLTGLEYCTNLTWLDLHNNQVSDLSPLGGLTKLTDIWLQDNKISDLSPLSGLTLTNLEFLYLYNNQISDLSPLAELTNLTGWLHLGSNQISDLSPLAGLVNLAELALNGNQISDLSPLGGLTKLTGLSLNSNQISDISPLATLTNVTAFDLEDNQISDLSPLVGLTTNLTGIDLKNNQISDLSPLAGMTNLIFIELNDNQISDILALVENSGLGAGNRIWLENNNIDLTEGSDDMLSIKILQDRGVEVIY